MQDLRSPRIVTPLPAASGIFYRAPEAVALITRSSTQPARKTAPPCGAKGHVIAFASCHQSARTPHTPWRNLSPGDGNDAHLSNGHGRVASGQCKACSEIAGGCRARNFSNDQPRMLPTAHCKSLGLRGPDGPLNRHRVGAFAPATSDDFGDECLTGLSSCSNQPALPSRRRATRTGRCMRGLPLVQIT